MSPTLEDQLRRYFADEATRAPGATGLAPAIRQRVRHRRIAKGALTSVAAAAGIAVAASLTGHIPISTPSAPSVTAEHGGRGGEPVPGGAAASCVESFSPTALARRSFAFDGTVLAVGPARSNRPQGDQLPLLGVTFRVNKWFTGGADRTVIVDMSPETVSGATDDERGLPFTVGTRLLVSGEPRWGGPALNAPIAWYCGFTRYFDEQQERQWRAAFRT